MTTTLRPAYPVPPGRILRREMEARGWAVADIATDGWSPVFYALLRGEGRIDADTAYHLAVTFGTSPELWLNLQRNYDEMTASKEEK